MAIDLEDEFPGQVDTATAGYPFGVPRNVSAPAAGDGTPWEDRIVKDIYGFFAAMLTDAGLTPSGAPDTALVSQYLQALDFFYGAYPLGRKTGLIGTVVDGTNLITVTAGTIRNQADTINLVLPAALQKNGAATWAPGDTNGGLADTVSLSTFYTYYRRFLINKPSPVVGADIVWDTDVAAANFFASAIAATEGYTDNTLYRRIAWDGTPNTGTNWKENYHFAFAPFTHRFKKMDTSIGSISDTSRTTIFPRPIPPHCFFNGVIEYSLQAQPSSAQTCRISMDEETDRAVTSADPGQLKIQTSSFGGGDFTNSMYVTNLRVNASSELFAREGPIAGTSANAAIRPDAYIDDLLTP